MTAQKSVARSWRQWATVAAAVALLPAMLTACGSGSDSGSSSGKLRVATIPGVSSLAIEVAEDQGYFEKNGLDVTVTGGTDVAAWQSAVGKQFDIVLSNAASYLTSVAKGVDNTLINGTVNATPTFAQNMLASVKPIESLADLKGTTIGAPTLTGLPTQALQYDLKQAGLAPGDYKIVAMTYDAQADNLKAGNVAATITASPYHGALKAAGLWVGTKDVCVTAVQAASDGAADSCSSVIFAANSGWAKSHKSDVNAWLTSLREAGDFIKKNPEQARTILQKWTGMPTGLAAQVVLPTYELPVPSDQLKPVWNVLKSNGTATTDYPADKVKVWKQ